jgi:DNA-binding response OmpR family regulator
VLVIDDDPSACELMVRSLSKEGFHVLTANEAWTACAWRARRGPTSSPWTS